MIGVAVGAMALVIVLSVFNGLEDLIRSLYNSFDPEIKISSVEGKTFELTDELLAKINSIPGIQLITEVIEDNAMVRYRDGNAIVKFKGVSDNFSNDQKLLPFMVQGQLALVRDDVQFAIVGRGIQYMLNISTRNDFYALQFFYPRNVRPGAMGLGNTNLYTQKIIMPGGVFAIEKKYDESYIFVPIEFAKELTGLENSVTSLEVKTDRQTSISKVQASLKQVLGADFSVLSTDEQHSSLLKAIQIEKLFVYLTFSFIMAVASFNIFFSLSMLAIEKKKDIAILFAMGATAGLVKRIFLYEGMLISFVGAFIGISLGLIICWLQQTFGFISMGMASAVLEAYPVKMQWPDFFFTGLSVIVITILAAFRPAYLAARIKIRPNL